MDFLLPELGEGVYEAEMSRWLVEPGQTVKPGQALLEVLTDKASMEVPAPFAGIIRELKAKAGQAVKVGEKVLVYDPPGQGDSPEPEKPAQAEAPVSAPVVVSTSPTQGVKAAPSVRATARQLGVDLASLKGTGPEGRVLLEDLTRAVNGRVAAAPKALAPEKLALEFGQAGTRVKLQGLRRKISEHMVDAKRIIPHYTYVDECDVSELVRVREGLRDAFQAKGAKLTYLSFAVKAAALALKEIPIVNASVDDEAGEIVLHRQVHVGIAVAVANGLLVPVIRDADRKSLLEISLDIQRLSEEARTGKAKLENLRGGTFTVTSIGNIGGLFATPIINHPEVGIVGLGKIVKRPIYDVHGQLKAADMLYLSYSFDHRILDGAIGASFGNAVMRWLQKPLEMLLG